MRGTAGMGKTKVTSAVQKEKDESIVFFRELHKHDTDVNLLEPMYSAEFDAIQGGHMSRPFSGRRDFLAEKHDYDWLKIPPAASLFPSLEVEVEANSMDRMRRIAGMGKTNVPSAVQKDKDESIVFFRELYKHEKDTDVNLLEPMYSVEFDAIQGGHMSRPPSSRRDFHIPIAEKHDYDWLKTPPATSLFPSPEVEVEANSSKMELPIPRQVKPSNSRFLGRPEGTKKASTRTGSSPKKNLFREAPSISNEKNQACTIDKRSTYTALPSRQQKPAAATARATPTTRNSAIAMNATSSNSALKQSYRFHAIQDSSENATGTVERLEEIPYKAPKNLLTTGSIFARRGVPTTTVAKGRSGGPAFGADNKGGSVGSRRPPPSTPAVATRGFKEPQVDSRKKALPAKGKVVDGKGSEPARDNGKAAWAKGMSRADGKNVRRPRFADK